MKTIIGIVSASTLAVGISQPTPVYSQGIGCEVILCMAGGFPGSECSDAKSYLLKSFKPPGFNPFVPCATTSYDAATGGANETPYKVPVRRFTRSIKPVCIGGWVVETGGGDSNRYCRKWTDRKTESVIAITLPDTADQNDENPGQDFYYEFVWRTTIDYSNER